MTFIYIKPKSRAPNVKKSGESQRALDKLASFLDDSSDEPVRFLVRFWTDQAAVITYKELRSIVLDEDVPQEIMNDWFNDYSTMLSNQMTSEWERALREGWKSKAEELRIDNILFESSEMEVRRWIAERTAELVTNCCEEQRKAIRYIVAEAAGNNMGTAETARYIRPCIGLTTTQAQANMKFYNNFKEQMQAEHPRMKPESVEGKARYAASRYAEKQHRYRADTIAQTELAKAFNKGNDEFVKTAIMNCQMPKMRRVWAVANYDACRYCKALEGLSVGMEEQFGYSYGVNKKHTVLIDTPPAHPRCRCVVKYVESDEKSDIMKLPRYEGAVIPKEKFLQYALNPDKAPDKAAAFKAALGYDLSNYQALMDDVRNSLWKYEAKAKGDDGYGMRYEVVMNLTGPNGKSAKVLTAWIDDNAKAETRLTTIHVDD